MAVLPESPPLTAEEQRVLLLAARESLRSHLDGRDLEKTDAALLPGTLTEVRGVFVSLHNGERLRGCTGYIEGLKPLVDAVRDLAVASGTRDRRFPPVTVVEVDELEIEVSVLSPLAPVAATSEIEIGRHGLYVRLGYRSGLLLPQVATKYGWDVETFLAHTCDKAGLPADAWREVEGMEIYAFTAQIFHEPAPRAGIAPKR